MDYEQKYKEALERARKLYNDAKVLEYTQDMEDYEIIFPELAESKDEKVRKALITFFQRFPYDSIEQAGTNAKEAIAWLEKQGEQKSIMNVPSREVILSIWDLGNEWKKLTNGSISTEYGTQLDYIQKHWHESEYYLRAKQDEKKVTTIDFNAKDWYVSKVDGKIHDITYNPTDKVEPKFHEGDWVVYMGTTAKILDLQKHCYVGKDVNDKDFVASYCNECEMKKWTIQDAKDGDVLVDKNYMGESPFIFKETKPSNIKTDVPNPLTVLGYCGIGGAGFTKSSGWGDTANCIYYPATKEQRDLLFQKMKEAGYGWDTEKKKLKKLTQSVTKISDQDAWSYEDEANLNNIIWLCNNCINGSETTWIPSQAKKIKHLIETIKERGLSQQKPTEWNEEDEENLQHCCGAVFAADYYTYEDKQDMEKWLLQLKERIGG